MPNPPEELNTFSSLLQVVKDLRGPDGCPWDKEQSHKTLTRFVIEEAHELAEAIDHGDQDLMVEELGDVLLQVVLHAEIGRQEGRFSIEDVIFAITDKMVRRHPHVFADVDVENSDEVLKNWAEIKAEEKSKKAAKPRNIFDIPEGLPALIRSHKIGEKTKKHNFDWERPEQVIEKIEEELQELKEAFSQGTVSEQEHEIGDLLFSVSQLARHLDLDSEQALRKTNQRFEKRFSKMQELADKELTQFSPDELEQLWQKAKSLT